MRQRLIYTREAIAEAAFELARQKGWTAVTARSVARKLGSSTMPIYSSMSSIDAIEREVRVRAESLLLDYQRRPFTDDPALNKAIGYVAFARDQKNLFRFLYVDRPLASGRRSRAGRTAATLEELLKSDKVPNLADQTRVARQDPRILKSWIFTHGLASMISSGVLVLPDEEIRDLLMEAGGAFFMFEEHKHE
jgi:AcrR family transcriptional regulator